MKSKLAAVFLGFGLICGFMLGGLVHRRSQVVPREWLLMEYRVGDRVSAVLEKEPGVVIGIDYNPVWNPEHPVHYFVTLDKDIERPGSRSAHGYRPSELSLINGK